MHEPSVEGTNADIVASVRTGQTVNRLWPFVALTLLLLAIHFFIVGHGITWPILDHYAQRQTQAAISAWWFLKEGFSFNYMTPVFGPPWSIPFEFPTYQSLVAILSGLTSMELEVAGRLVNLFFFYIGIACSLGLLWILGIPGPSTTIAAILMLASPFYLFWSRTFMIESTATTLGIGALLAFFYALKVERYRWMTLAVLLGTLAALTKVTSYGLFLVFGGLVLLAQLAGDLRLQHHIDRNMLLKLACYVAISAVPVASAVGWNSFADMQKAKSPLADFLLSANMFEWNFGTWEQRFDPGTWTAVHERAGLILGVAPVALISLLSLFSSRTRVLGAASLITFMTGPVVFTNLYVVHEYYFFPGGIFLLMAVALGIIALVELRGRTVPAVLLVSILAVMGVRYQEVYPALIDGSRHNPLRQVAFVVRENTRPDDVILIYGMGWKPMIPFYAERRAIMDPTDRPLDEPAIKSAIARVGQDNIGAMVVCEYVGRRTQASIQAKVSTLSLIKGPRAGRCDIWLPNSMGRSTDATGT